MRHLRSLRAAIVDDPDDLGARRVYADVLLENGDPRGEFIHLQLSPSAASRETERALLARYAPHWMLPLRAEDGQATFARGFVEEWSCNSHQLFARGPRVAAAMPLRKLSVSDLTGRHVQHLSRSPALRGVKELELRGLRDWPFHALAEARFKRLERLSLSGHPWPGSYGFSEMLGRNGLGQLRELNLDLPIGAHQAAQLENLLRELESLTVRGAVPGSAAPKLRRLRVHGAEALEPLIALVRGAPKLELLVLEDVQLTVAVARCLGESRSLQRVRLLKVAGEPGARRIVDERFSATSRAPAPIATC